MHLHERGLHEKPGLAAAADDQDVFVPGVLGIFRAAGHGELFRLGQKDVPVGDRINIGGNIHRRAPFYQVLYCVIDTLKTKEIYILYF